MNKRGDSGHPYLVHLLKAFDNLNWSFLFELFGKLKIGDKFATAIKGIYKNQRARLIINNKLTDWISIVNFFVELVHFCQVQKFQQTSSNEGKERIRWLKQNEIIKNKY